MNNYRYFINVLEKDKPYNHKELYAELLRQKPDMSKNSIQWIIHDLCKTGDIVHDMYNHYRLPKAEEKRVYIPDYSVISRNVTKVIQKKYPTVDFTIFESIQLNEFLNHLVAQNTIFIQCEKEMSDFVFRYLQDEKYPNLMYLPSVDNFHYYWANNCLVVTNLIQEAPLNRQNPHAIRMEKLLVDLYCDKLIQSTYNSSEYNSVLQQAFERYNIDVIRMLRYSRRRGKGEEIKTMMQEFENA